MPDPVVSWKIQDLEGLTSEQIIQALNERDKVIAEQQDKIEELTKPNRVAVLGRHRRKIFKDSLRLKADNNHTEEELDSGNQAPETPEQPLDTEPFPDFFASMRDHYNSSQSNIPIFDTALPSGTPLMGNISSILAARSYVVLQLTVTPTNTMLLSESLATLPNGNTIVLRSHATGYLCIADDSPGDRATFTLWCQHYHKKNSSVNITAFNVNLQQIDGNQSRSIKQSAPPPKMSFKEFKDRLGEMNLSASTQMESPKAPKRKAFHGDMTSAKVLGGNGQSSKKRKISEKAEKQGDETPEVKPLDDEGLVQFLAQKVYSFLPCSVDDLSEVILDSVCGVVTNVKVGYHKTGYFIAAGKEAKLELKRWHAAISFKGGIPLAAKMRWCQTVGDPTSEPKD